MINIGVLGFAHGHIACITQRWKEDPSLDIFVKGGWDHDAERAKTQCETLGCRIFDSAEELLADPDITSVIIGAETSFHAELTEKAAAAGKAIICYKPMALTMEQADRMVAAVKKYNVPFTMGYQMRVDPQNIKIKELIQNGEIGKICLFRRRHGLGTQNWPNFDKAWHTDPAYNRDIFADDAAHPVDLMNWIFGMPESVMCEMSTMVNPGIPNDNGVCIFKYPDGKIVELSLSFTCSASEITTEVYGEKGAIQQYFGDGPSTRLPRLEGMEGLMWFKEGDSGWTKAGIPSPKSHGERLYAQAEPFSEFLHGRRGPICTVEEGRNNLRCVLACYLSAQKGCRIQISDDGVYDIQ